MSNVNIGFEILADIPPQPGKSEALKGEASINKSDLARAIGVENAEFGEADQGFVVELSRSSNAIDGTATAQARKTAFADGVRNIGKIELANTPGLIEGVGEAVATQGELTFATGINSTNDGIIRGKDNAARLEGEAIATGKDEVGAFGILTTNLNTNRGRDNLQGRATARGISSTDARGVSVGFSDIDDDTTAGSSGELAPTASGVAEIGSLTTGDRNDTIQGTADVEVAGKDGDEIFFAGANGIVNDGGRISQLKELLASVGKNLGNFETKDVEKIIDHLDTSRLDTGAGRDSLIAEVTLRASQAGEGADSDLEVIGDGIENAGKVFLGSGNDSINSTVDVRSTIKDAKGLADALDNSSVGIITGLNLEVNNATLFDLGSGNDTFTSDIFATAVNDLSAADGLGNRGTFVAGTGDDSFNLNARSEFVLDHENDAQQQEGIADGWENRSRVFLDDPNRRGGGNDSVRTSAKAFGEGVLTIAEGLESRELFDAGNGDDTFDLEAVATTEAGALPDNLTQASGLQTEQVDEGEFLLHGGNNTVIGEATANSQAVANHEFSPTTFAFGITQMTADANNTNPHDGQGLIESGNGKDLFRGTATASGQTEVAAFGLLFENAHTKGGNDTLFGKAKAESADVALAAGIAVGLAEDVYAKYNSVNSRPNDDFDYGLGAEAGILKTGNQDDVLSAVADASAAGKAIARGVDGANSTINLGSGNDTLTAQATATSEKGEIESFGIFGGTIDAGGGSDNIRTHSNDDLTGSFDIQLNGGQGLGGDVVLDLGAGNDTLLGFGEANVDGGDGIDTLQFEFSLEDFIFGGGTVDVRSDSSGNRQYAISIAGVTMEVENFERLQLKVDFDNGITQRRRRRGVAETFDNHDELMHAIEEIQATQSLS